MTVRVTVLVTPPQVAVRLTVEVAWTAEWVTVNFTDVFPL